MFLLLIEGEAFFDTLDKIIQLLLLNSEYNNFWEYLIKCLNSFSHPTTQIISCLAANQNLPATLFTKKFVLK